MRKDWVRAERDNEVRQAARAWRKAGVIDDPGLARAEELFPAPWPNPTAVWGVLAFVFVSFAAVALFAAIALASHWHSIAAVAFLLAAALAVMADRFRPSASGPASASAGAAAFWSVTCLMIGTADAAGWRGHSVTLVLILGAAAWAAAAWRWGYPVFAVFAAASLFFVLARFDQGRALWLILGTVLAAACVPLLDRRSVAPSHRRAIAGVLAVCLVAVYVAVNPYSVDRDIVESIASSHSPSSVAGARAGASPALAVTVLPLFLLAWGIRSRRALVLDLGIVFAALSLATLRYYIHIAPLWAVLAVAGGALIGLALSLNGWLDRAPGRKRRGFTADPLFEDEEKSQALGVAAAALTLTPGPRSEPQPEAGAFRGGGGASGGGGSSGKF